MNILALGDCNTLGTAHYNNNSFPERFARKIQAHVKNCGYTMTTTREMIYFAKENLQIADIILIQYGLVDSWLTFKYSPYVLYCPDNLLRKILRKIVKKYKKIARRLGLNKAIGAKNVVPINEYKNSIKTLVENNQNKIFILIDTVPNNHLDRNENIKKYNKILEEIAQKYKNCYYLDIYEIFINNLDNYYADATHINGVGYDVITNKLLKLYEKVK